MQVTYASRVKPLFYNVMSQPLLCFVLTSDKYVISLDVLICGLSFTKIIIIVKMYNNNSSNNKL